MAQYVLEILDGDRAGEVLPVPDGALRIGRKPSNDLVLADEKTSGVHAEVVLEGDRHVLRDLGSTNGTFLDGKRVTEVVLTTGDVVTVGRLRVKFREQGDATGGETDFAMHRLDARRVQKRGGALPVLIGLLVLGGAGAGGWFWWNNQQQQQAGSGEPTVQQQKAALVVAGNKLPQAVASCEAEDGWKLAEHGLAFQTGSRAHTGKAGLEAVRVEGEQADFGIATPAESLTVFSGRSLTIAAHVRTDGSARAGVRALFSNSNESSPLRFRTGSALVEARGEWQRLEFTVGVPSGCDRLDVEVVALLPDNDAVAYVDDVAVTEAGSAAPLDQKFDEGPQQALGTGTAFALQSTDVTLFGIAPGTVPPAFAGLHGADLCVLSDLGGELAVTPGPRSVTLAATGVNDLQFQFPADSAGQTLARAGADGPFEPVSAAGEQSATALLLGITNTTRVLLRTDAAVPFVGQLGGGLYRVRVGAANVELVVSFFSEGQRALELRREAEAADADHRHGEALALLERLQREVPEDSEVLAQAARLRAQIAARLDDQLAELQREFDEAQFFDTRGGFERVARGVDRLTELYGEATLATRPLASQLHEGASTRLAALDAERQKAEEQRLDELAAAFKAAEQPGLAKLVEDYKQRRGEN